MTEYTSGEPLPAAGVTAVADGSITGKVNSGGMGEVYYLIRKCDACCMFKLKPHYCFKRGHPLGLLPVRASADGSFIESVASGEKLQSLEYKFYHMLKPGSRVLEWNDRGEVSEVPWADLAGRATVALAPGSLLQRSTPTKKVELWLTSVAAGHMVGSKYSAGKWELEDLSIPPRVQPAGGAGGKIGGPGWVWVEEDDGEEEEGGASGGEGATAMTTTMTPFGDDVTGGSEAHRSSSSHKRKKPSQAARAAEAPGRGSDGGGQKKQQKQQQQQGKGAPQKPSKRRKPSRAGSGGRASPGLGGAEVDEAHGSMSHLATKDEVHQALEMKLRACDKRDQELNAVIEEATAELQKNSDRREAAVAESERQLLAIIAQREAKAAYYEQLAAQARAQNTSDRESLLAHQERVVMEQRSQSLTARDAPHQQRAAARTGTREGGGVVPMRPFSVGTRTAGVTGSSSWSIGAQAARVVAQAQAQPTRQVPPAQAPSARALPAQAPDGPDAVQASVASAEARPAEATVGAAAPSTALPLVTVEYKRPPCEEESSGAAKENPRLVETGGLQLEGRKSEAPARAPAPAFVVRRSTSSPPAGLVRGDKAVSAGMTGANPSARAPPAVAAAPVCTTTLPFAEPAAPATGLVSAAKPSDNAPSSEGASMAAAVSGAVLLGPAAAAPSATAHVTLGDGGEAASSSVAGGGVAHAAGSKRSTAAPPATAIVMGHGWPSNLHPSSGGGGSASALGETATVTAAGAAANIVATAAEAATASPEAALAQGDEGASNSLGFALSDLFRAGGF